MSFFCQLSCQTAVLFLLLLSDTVVVGEKQEVDVPFTEKAQAQAQAQAILRDCQSIYQDEHQQLKQCVKRRLADVIKNTRQDISYFDSIRKKQGSQWEEFACQDNELETSASLKETTWEHVSKDDASYYPVRVLHDYSSSQIHLLENFITPDECHAVLTMSDERLHRAKVHDGKGGNHFSDHRRAWQAGVHVDWDLEDYNDEDEDHEEDRRMDHLIARLSRRVYDYTNHVLQLNITEKGQEDMMSIQYFGKNNAQLQQIHNTNATNATKDTKPDRYAPHCDGECSGRPHKRGNRMATMVMYCEVPVVGGHTNFRNAGVHIQPKQGAALFFSYVNPTTFQTDHGFTSHSGCPVYEGNKKIVTQWIRLGVDELNTHRSFNTLGVQTNDAEYDSEDDQDDEEDWDRYTSDEDEDNDDDDDNDEEVDVSDDDEEDMTSSSDDDENYSDYKYALEYEVIEDNTNGTVAVAKEAPKEPRRIKLIRRVSQATKVWTKKLQWLSLRKLLPKPLK